MESIFNANLTKKRTGLGYQRRHAEDRLTLAQKKALKKQKKLDKMAHLKPLKSRKDSQKKKAEPNAKGEHSGLSKFMRQSVSAFEASPTLSVSDLSLSSSVSLPKPTFSTSPSSPLLPTSSPPSSLSSISPLLSSEPHKEKNISATTKSSSKKKKKRKKGQQGEGATETENSQSVSVSSNSSSNSSSSNSSSSNSSSSNSSSSNGEKGKKKKKKGSTEVPVLTANSNPLLEVYKKAMSEMPEDMHMILKPNLSDERRAHLFSFLDLDHAEKYAWAIPDERALRIIAHFAPVVEIGCGRGYWGSLLKARDVDWVGYDLHAVDDNTGNPPWTQLKKGGPNDIKRHPKSALMLSYPDDFEDSEQSLASQCLKVFKGSIVVLIGEHFGATFQDNPWGKSAEALFQQDLAAQFHLLLRVPLPSWPTSWDAISVWKRTAECVVDDVVFRDVPIDEQAQICVACPAVQHLLK